MNDGASVRCGLQLRSSAAWSSERHVAQNLFEGKTFFDRQKEVNHMIGDETRHQECCGGGAAVQLRGSRSPVSHAELIPQPPPPPPSHSLAAAICTSWSLFYNLSEREAFPQCTAASDRRTLPVWSTCTRAPSAPVPCQKRFPLGSDPVV